jgi:hypothetical protein
MAGGWDDEAKGGSASFLEKRSKKLLLSGVWAVSLARAYKDRRFFCFFFVHKKEDLLQP